MVVWFFIIMPNCGGMFLTVPIRFWISERSCLTDTELRCENPWLENHEPRNAIYNSLLTQRALFFQYFN